MVGKNDLTDLTERLRKLLDDATPGDLSTAERHVENETVECPLCHEGEVEAADYCNIDGKALGVQFYGIGKEFGAHERLWSETLAALPELLTTLETLTQENARLREALRQHSLVTLIGMINAAGGKITVHPRDVENAVNQEVIAYYDPTNDTKVYRVRARKALGGGDE